jgi:cob(I)alamin adenosyltransferase
MLLYFRLAREFAKDGEHSYTDKLKRIQCILVDISASILRSSESGQQICLSARHTKDLEEWIEEYSCQLPPLENYVIPVSLLN